MILQNTSIIVKINSFGAEVRSIVKNGVEFMWQADPIHWNRTSPILFPFVGKLLDDEYIYNNVHYKMTQHGFGRDNEFIVVESSNTHVRYLFQDNEETIQKYPFKFDLFVEYRLIDNQVEVHWTVVNTSKTAMYFQIGAHPAFNFKNGSFVDVNKTTNRYRFGEIPHICSVMKDVDVSSIEIDNNSFIHDAIIFDNVEHLKLHDEMKSVEIICDGFPYVGIWSKVKHGDNAPFVCLEPWHGITDFKGHDKQLKNKRGMISLEAMDMFHASYKMIFN